MSWWRGRRKLVVIVAATLALIGVVVGYRRLSRRSEAAFETTAVDRGRIMAKVTATGTLSALVTVQVGAQVSGRLSQIFVDFNSQVTKGQVLAKLDPDFFSAALEQTRANYTAAQANVLKAKVQATDADRQFKRAQSLAERDLIAAADRDTAQATADAARAQVQSAEASLEQSRAALHQAEVNLTYTTIVSPINGIVLSRSVDVGQTVAASLQAPVLFLIAEDLSKMQVDTSVAEADVGKLSPGMEASFTVDAYPAERFHGKVRQIRNAPQTVQNVVTYDVVIDVNNADLKLKPGMTANVTFVHADKTDVLRVPNAALRFRPPPEMLGRPARGASEAKTPDKAAATPDQRTVWVLREKTPQPLIIRTGVSDGTLSEVTSGHLEAGDQVITDLKAGRATNPQASGGPPRRMF
jgi:HlyD family secretion protein